MPAGVPWSTYLRFTFACSLSMLGGAQTVHQFYRPLEDLDIWVEKFTEEKKIYEQKVAAEKEKNQ